MNNLNNLLDEVYIDLPDYYSNSFKLKGKPSCSCLSFHGHMLGIGFNSGIIQILDSETGILSCNFEKSLGSITSLSFSRDGHYLLSSDNQGNIIIRSLLTKKEIFTKKFDYNNIQCYFSPINPFLFIIFSHTNENSFHIINFQNNSIENLPGLYSSFKFNIDGNLILTTKNFIKIFNFNSPFNLLNEFQIDFKRGLFGIEISHNGNYLLLLERSGTTQLFDFRLKTIIFSFSDTVNRFPFNSGVFDRMDEYIILGSNQIGINSFSAYNLSNGLIRKNYTGPKEGTFQILFHPIYPIIFTRGSKGIHIWKPIYKDRWIHTLPEKNKLIQNIIYDEPESEFDEDHQIQKPDQIQCIDIGFIDVINKNNYYYFESDKNFPNQIFKIPITIEDMIQNSNDNNEEEQESN